ncbi:hypothetical protein QW180_13745 [Vibrio sinaloensis]|nr:hypothetical protein [Vibrio sinaloensis]
MLNGKPHLVATSRVCNSDGMDCDKGYMMFIKQIGDQFSQTLMQATGLDVDIWTKQQAQARNFQPSADVSVIEKLDYRNQPNVCVIIRHLATTPPFYYLERAERAIGVCLFYVCLQPVCGTHHG